MDNYKFGISYNVFDGEELLEDSIKILKEYVDYISVIYQTRSNYNHPCSDDLLNILFDLKDRGLVDDLKEYVPDISLGPHRNEITKRNIGLELSKNNGCTHHMTIDCDEFYVDHQFQYLIDWHKNNPSFVSFCQLVNYYKSPEYLMELKDDTNVTLFFPIKENTLFIMGYPTPVLIDPTRKPNCDLHHVFSENEIVMHHMTMVRKNIRSKLINSSALVNYNHGSKINDIVTYYNNWDESSLVGINSSSTFKLKKIEPLFILSSYYNYKL